METTGTTPASQMVMDLLARHVPLSLLVDLAAPDGPWSSSIYDHERFDHTESPIWESVRPTFELPKGAGTPQCVARHPLCGTGDPCPLQCWRSPHVKVKVTAA